MLDQRAGPGPPPTEEPTEHVRVAIVGSGFSGLGLAMRLKQGGEHDFAVLERAEDLGGTWRDNTYPGCACDIPSHLYSFSFAPNPGWSRTYSRQPEIWDYLRHCAEDFGVTPHLRLGHGLLDARWDEDADRWTLETSGGALTASVLVVATGPLSEPSVPSVPGLETFEGTAFHSARWNHEHDLTGRRVAAVGTGASAIQFVPRIQPEVERLHVFQRTPPWIMPHPDRPIRDVERRLYRRLPAAQRLVRGAVYAMREALAPGFVSDQRLMSPWERVALRHLRREVPDAALRARLTPRYRMGCKRILQSDDWYRALGEPNVELIAEGVREVRPRSVVGADGTEREVDTLIFGTGFQILDLPLAPHVRGRDGVSLEDSWRDSTRAHLGTTIAGFPNLFMLIGPNTGLGHNSMVYMIESQVAYVLDALRQMDRGGLSSFEVRPEVQEEFNDELERSMETTVWTRGGCSSWYLDESGRNATLWPSFTFSFRRRTRRFDAADYRVRTRRDVPAPAGATHG